MSYDKCNNYHGQGGTNLVGKDIPNLFESDQQLIYLILRMDLIQIMVILICEK